jgi:microcystin-dependent protein
MAFPYLANRTYSGSALPTTLSTQMGSSDATFTLLNAATWLTTDAVSSTSPLGTPVANGIVGTANSAPFVVAVDYGTANEEKILCSSVNLTSNVVTVWTDGTRTGRGYDGTIAGTHASGVVCVPVFSAIEADEANNAAAGTLGIVAASGDLLVGNGAQTLSRLASGASNTVLVSDGSGGLSWTAGINPTATILDYAGATAPGGYLLCDGSAVSRTTYSALYAIISTTYGTGNGSTTFNVPDFRGRTAIGAGTGTASGATAWARGVPPTTGAGGEQTHLLTGPESGIQSHTHTVNSTFQNTVTTAYTAGSNNYTQTGYNPATTSAAGPTNATTAHNIMQPHVVVNKIIKY